MHVMDSPLHDSSQMHCWTAESFSARQEMTRSNYGNQTRCLETWPMLRVQNLSRDMET